MSSSACPAGAPALRTRVGYVTQSPAVYRDLTVIENLRYFAAVLGAGSTDVDRVLDAVGLHDSGSHVVGNLSGGQQARVSLATALLGAPELLVLDEPTVGLDPVLRRDLWQCSGNSRRDGVSLIVSSHVMGEAKHCQRLVLLRDGAMCSLTTRRPNSAGKLALTISTTVFLRLIEGES